jgi:two-component system, OmpR family, response regulator
MIFAVIGGVVLVVLALAAVVVMRSRAAQSPLAGRAAQPIPISRRAEPARPAVPQQRSDPPRRTAVPEPPAARTTHPPTASRTMAPPATLPRATAAPRPTVGAPARQSPATGPSAQTVLIVDDSPIMRRTLMSLFAKVGYHTASAESGDAAVAWVRGNGLPGFITLDMEMPGMDGLQTLDALHALGASGELRAAFVTSKVQSDRVREVASGKGAIGFFSKPYDPAALLGLAQRMAPLARSASR